MLLKNHIFVRPKVVGNFSIDMGKFVIFQCQISSCCYAAKILTWFTFLSYLLDIFETEDMCVACAVFTYSLNEHVIHII